MIYFISDYHLGHENIIKYCNRPFKSVEEMNETLLFRWNTTVGKEDLVYYLGDIRYGRNNEDEIYWWNKLNGNKILIKGNHDRDISKIKEKYSYKLETFNNTRFLLIHSPEYDKPEYGYDWIIHGHHHNNFPDKFPLINKENKTINVSAEVLNYYPISLNKLLFLIGDR